MNEYFLTPSGKEITAATIIVYNPTGEITVCQNLPDYLNFLDDLNDRDNKQWKKQRLAGKPFFKSHEKPANTLARFFPKKIPGRALNL